MAILAPEQNKNIVNAKGLVELSPVC